MPDRIETLSDLKQCVVVGTKITLIKGTVPRGAIGIGVPRYVKATGELTLVLVDEKGENARWFAWPREYEFGIVAQRSGKCRIRIAREVLVSFYDIEFMEPL